MTAQQPPSVAANLDKFVGPRVVWQRTCVTHMGDKAMARVVLCGIGKSSYTRFEVCNGSDAMNVTRWIECTDMACLRGFFQDAAMLMLDKKDFIKD